jgi:hypothetical protein
MTDDEILDAARVILKKRMDQKRLDSFLASESVTIRWDVPIKFGLEQSYCGIDVPRDQVAELVINHYKALIEG